MDEWSAVEADQPLRSSSRTVNHQGDVRANIRRQAFLECCHSLSAHLIFRGPQSTPSKVSNRRTGCGAKTERSLAIKLSGNFARFAYDVAPNDAAKAGARWAGGRALSTNRALRLLGFSGPDTVKP